MASPAAETIVLDLLRAENPDLDGIMELRDRVRGSRQERAALREGLAALGRLAAADARLAAAHWALGHAAEAAAHAAKAGGHPLGAFVGGLLADAAGNGEEALKHFRKAAELAPTCAPLALQPIDCLRRLGRLDEAMEQVEQRRRDFSDKALLAFHEARCLEDLGRHQDALDCYGKALEIAPGLPEAAFRAAYLSDLRGDEAGAIRLYTLIGPENDALYPHACLNLALLHDDAGDYEKAAACCRRVLKADPRNAKAKMFLADIDAARGMYYSPEETKQSERLEAVLRVPVTDFELSVRSRNCLANMNIQTLGDLVKRTESEMLAYKNFGETSLREVKEMLTSRGLRLGMLREDAATRAAMERQRRNQSLEVLQKAIADMELGVRAKKCCENLGLVTVGDLVAKSEAELQGARNFGRVSLNEIKKRLGEMGLSLREDDEGDEAAPRFAAADDDDDEAAQTAPSIAEQDLL